MKSTLKGAGVTLGERLRKARREADVSQAELAAGACSLSYVSHVEAGRRQPSAELIDHFEKVLNLPSGALEEEPVDHHDGIALEALCAAIDARHAGAFSFAYENATRARRIAQNDGDVTLTWLASREVSQALAGSGRYLDAAHEADGVLEEGKKFDNDLLAARGQILAAGNYYLAGDQEQAQRHAMAALGSVTWLPEGSAPRLRALQLLLASGASAVDAETQLREELHHAPNDQVRGLSEWALGTRAFEQGDSAAGVGWHEAARKHLSPAADYRNWARFLRASVNARVRAGILEDGEALIEEARLALGHLGAVDELADLEVTAALYERQMGHPGRAQEISEAALGWEDVPEETRAKLYEELAHAHAVSGNLADARSSILEAARHFTFSGRLEQATEAWRLADLWDSPH